MTEPNEWQGGEDHLEPCQMQDRPQADAAPTGAPAAEPQGGPAQPAPGPQSQPRPAQPQPGYAPQPQPVPPRYQQPPSGYAYAPVYGVPPAGAQPVAPTPVKKSRGWIVALVAIVLVFILCMAGMGSCTASMGNAMNELTGSLGASDADITGDTIGIIPIGGTIQYDGTTSSPEGLKAQLDKAEANPNIKAVVLRVNSGGGVATAGEEMSTYVKNFSKPVVVSSASINASAAYEISSQADYIYTAKTTSIGSIGTAMQVTDLSGLYEKLGISIDNIVSSDSKDSTYGTRALTEKEREFYQATVDQINDVFIRTVAEGRNMDYDAVKELANGLAYTGIDAVNNGLADEIGTLQDAVAKACDLAGISSANTVYLQPKTSRIDSIIDILGEDKSHITDEALKELEDRVGLEG